MRLARHSTAPGAFSDWQPQTGVSQSRPAGRRATRHRAGAIRHASCLQEQQTGGSGTCDHSALLVPASAPPGAARGAGGAQAGATLDDVKSKGFVQCGVNVSGLPGFAEVDANNNWSGPRRRPVPRRRRRHVRRRDQGQVHAAQRQGALHRAAVGRDRRPVAQHDLDQLARQRARPRFRRRQLLRRPGLHGAEVAGRRQRAGARRRLGLRADRHHHRAQPRRLLPRQQHEVHAGRVREQRRGQQGLRGRPLRRADHRPVGPLRDPRQAGRTPTTTSSCRR